MPSMDAPDIDLVELALLKMRPNGIPVPTKNPVHEHLYRIADVDSIELTLFCERCGDIRRHDVSAPLTAFDHSRCDHPICRNIP